jgi:hypothetical protein
MVVYVYGAGVFRTLSLAGVLGGEICRTMGIRSGAHRLLLCRSNEQIYRAWRTLDYEFT